MSLRDDLVKAAGSPGRVLDMDAIVDRSADIGRQRRRMAGAGALLPVLLVMAVSWVAIRPPQDRAVGSVLEVPPAGQASGQFLDDGTPVWVTQSVDGDVHVLEAQHPDGFHVWASHQVLWCNRTLLESRWASRFALDGPALSGPSADGLRRFEISSIDGGRLVVGPLDPTPGRRDHSFLPELGPLSCAPEVAETHPAWADTFDQWHDDWYER
ncbi:MAG: hypothetical protein ACXIVQ_17505 [Acidimicrobiales bacterium]